MCSAKDETRKQSVCLAYGIAVPPHVLCIFTGDESLSQQGDSNPAFV